MNKTTAIVGLVSGIAGAGITYTFKSNDTAVHGGVARIDAPNSNILSPPVRISPQFKDKFETAIKKSREHVKRFKTEIGVPGVVVGVSVDGEIIWEEGFGYSNLETGTPCSADTAMRIASISKPITTTLLAKLWELKKVDLDKSVHEYVPYFPRKSVDGEAVDLTVRQLANHTAGIRHYKKKGEKKNEFEHDSGKEFYSKDSYDSVEKSVSMFKDDELLYKPGTGFEYTTHGYTLLSAVIENVEKTPFTNQIQDLFKILSLKNTHLDEVDKIIYGRSSYYHKNKQGYIINAELANNSYKWAGGGLISTVGDLLKFGNIMLYCYQQSKGDTPGFLKKETVEEFWTPAENSHMKWGQNAGYGLGWTIVPKIEEVGGVIESQKFHVGHSGGAVGASSVLIVLPKELKPKQDENKNEIRPKLPQGVSVAILVNLENVSCRPLGQTIAQEFYKV